MPNLLKRCVPFVACSTSKESISLYPVFQARYCVKFKQPEGKLVLKITDDETVRSLTFYTQLDVVLNVYSRSCAVRWYYPVRGTVSKIQNPLIRLS